MTSNPCQLLIRLLFSVIACALNYRQVAGFVKATDKHRINGCTEKVIRLSVVRSNPLPLCLKQNHTRRHRRIERFNLA